MGGQGGASRMGSQKKRGRMGAIQSAAVTSQRENGHRNRRKTKKTEWNEGKAKEGGHALKCMHQTALKPKTTLPRKSQPSFSFFPVAYFAWMATWVVVYAPSHARQYESTTSCKNVRRTHPRTFSPRLRTSGAHLQAISRSPGRRAGMALATVEGGNGQDKLCAGRSRPRVACPIAIGCVPAG